MLHLLLLASPAVCTANIAKDLALVSLRRDVCRKGNFESKKQKNKANDSQLSHTIGRKRQTSSRSELPNYGTSKRR